MGAACVRYPPVSSGHYNCDRVGLVSTLCYVTHGRGDVEMGSSISHRYIGPQGTVDIGCWDPSPSRVLNPYRKGTEVSSEVGLLVEDGGVDAGTGTGEWDER